MPSEAPRVTIRPARLTDAKAWCWLRHVFWPEESVEEHAAYAARFFARKGGEPLAVLVAEAADGTIVGFAELSIRHDAEGCRTHRIGYLEGWYVVPEARRHGVGRALVAAGEAWARREGCLEFASDTPVANDASTAAHAALGFQDVGVIRCFRKELPAEGA